jgi:hypothetical protein
MTAQADDGVERHYAEKIWGLIPEVYRNEDGGPAQDGPLRALVEILAGQAAIARRSIDRLWADQHIDEADDWAVPYIGGLVGARPVNALNRPGQRANAGRTILYRRRQGTVRLAELLADDIADWDAVASEAFCHLLRTWHMLDGGPAPGPVTASPRGGFADLRNARIGDLLDHAHDDTSRLPDFRRHRGVWGRANIPKLNLHLFRQFAFPLAGVTPARIADGLYTLDPSGRDVALFQPGGRATEECVAAREWQMRAPIPCRRLNAAGFRPLRAHAPVGLEDLLAPIYGRRFATEAGLLEAANAALAADPAAPNALTDTQAAALIDRAMEPETPRRNLLPGGDPAARAVALAVANDSPLGPQHLYGANLAEWAQDHGVPGWVRALVDPARGRVRLMAPLAADELLKIQRIHYGAFWPVGAGTHDRAPFLARSGFAALQVEKPDFSAPVAGEFRFMDSRSFRPLLAANAVIQATGSLTLSAANFHRPYVAFSPASGRIVTLRSVSDTAELVIDGLWIGVFPAAGSGETVLRIDGTWRKVTLRNVTLDPGGVRAAAPGQSGEEIPPVLLQFGGAIDDLVIEHCVTGRIEERVTALDPCATDTVGVRDSIVGGNAAGPAIRLRNAALAMDSCTVFGDVITGRLDASHVLVDGRVLAENQQEGCFRFGAARAGGRVPHPYESHFFADGVPAGCFVSRRFGDAGYAQLTEIAPAAIREGGEGGTEIGAFNRALDPIKRADLRAKLEEFLPINVIAQLVFET